MAYDAYTSWSTELLFKVKPKMDPLGILPATDYSTCLKVSANGISVCVPDPSSGKCDHAYVCM